MTETEIRIDENDLPSAVVHAIREGRKIVAIKLLREATGLGLANAKVIVDRAAQRQPDPGHATAPLTEDTGSRRVLVMMLALMIAYLAYRWFAGS